MGASADDGSGNALTDSGAVYLFTFTDSAFSGGTLVSTIGSGYTGENDINLNLDASDGFGESVSLDDTRLVAGANFDDGALDGTTDSGAIYLFTFADEEGAVGVLMSKDGSALKIKSMVEKVEVRGMFGNAIEFPAEAGRTPTYFSANGFSAAQMKFLFSMLSYRRVE